MFSAPSQPMAQPSAAKPQSAPAPAHAAARPVRKQNYLPLFIGLGLLLLIAIVVILIFAVRK
jgi:flagellar biogenesis protein FliO